MSSTITALTSGGGLAMAGDTSGQLELKTNNGTTAVTIDTSQNVGIGNTRTSVKLFAQASGQRVIEFSDASNYSVGMGYSPSAGGASVGWIGGTGGSALALGANNAENMRIDTSGNLWVRSTGTVEPYNATTGSFTKIGDASYPILATAPNLVCILNRNTSTGVILEFKYNGTAYGSVSTNGSSVTYNTTSDYRLKEAIVPMVGALDKVAQLKPYTYTWKANGESSQGFIAHELAEVYPDVVTGEKDAVDEEGNPTYQAVDYSKLVATLTAAIQELNAKVDAQALEIQALKGVA